MTITPRKGDTVVEVDEAPRVTPRSRRSQAPADLPEGRRRHTAGNSPGVNDGGGAILVASSTSGRSATAAGTREDHRSGACRRRVRGPRANACRGRPAGARKGRPTAEDVDLWEINEAFASVMLNSMRTLGDRREQGQRQWRRRCAGAPDRRVGRSDHRDVLVRVPSSWWRYRVRRHLLRGRPRRCASPPPGRSGLSARRAGEAGHMRVRHDHIIGLGLGAVVVGAAVAFVHAINFSPSFDAYGWLSVGPSGRVREPQHGRRALLEAAHLSVHRPVRARRLRSAATVDVHRDRGGTRRRRCSRRESLCASAPLAREPHMRDGSQRSARRSASRLSAATSTVLIASSDPMVLALCLAAIDFHLRGHPRTAFVMVVLAALGRPEMWPFALAYSVWAWRAVPRMRIMLVVGILSLPACWFRILGAHVEVAVHRRKLALGFKDRIRGSKLDGTSAKFPQQLPLAVPRSSGSRRSSSG